MYVNERDSSIKSGSILVGKMFGRSVRKIKPIIPNSNTKAFPNAILPAKVEAVAKKCIPIHFNKNKEEKTSVGLIPQKKKLEGVEETQTPSSLKIKPNQGVEDPSNTPTMIPSKQNKNHLS